MNGRGRDVERARQVREVGKAVALGRKQLLMVKDNYG